MVGNPIKTTEMGFLSSKFRTPVLISIVLLYLLIKVSNFNASTALDSVKNTITNKLNNDFQNTNNQPDPNIIDLYQQNFEKINQARLDQVKKTCQKMLNSNEPSVRSFNQRTKAMIDVSDVQTSDNWLTELYFSSFYYVPRQIQSKNGLNSKMAMHHKLINREKEGHENQEIEQKLYDDIQKFSIKSPNLFCVPPKTGTTNWQTVLNEIYYQNWQMLVNFLKYTHKNPNIRANFTYVDPYTFHSPEHVMGDNSFFEILPKLRQPKYYNKREQIVNDPYRKKIMNVRHPVERLYSAWNQKFKKTHWTVDNFVEKFITSGAISKATETETHVCGFDEFVDYFLRTWELNPDPQIASQKIKLPMDFHWHTLLSCMPCHIDYDYITKTEFLDQDSRPILDELFNRPDLSIRGRYKTSKQTNTLELANSWLSDSQKEGLRQRFRWELEMFGYQY